MRLHVLYLQSVSHKHFEPLELGSTCSLEAPRASQTKPNRCGVPPPPAASTAFTALWKAPDVAVRYRSSTHAEAPPPAASEPDPHAPSLVPRPCSIPAGLRATMVCMAFRAAIVAVLLAFALPPAWAARHELAAMGRGELLSRTRSLMAPTVSAGETPDEVHLLGMRDSS